MISAQDIVAWRPFAPWSTDLMVEQDFLLSRAVELIFEDKFLSQQVAMRGGTGGCQNFRVQGWVENHTDGRTNRSA